MAGGTLTLFLCARLQRHHYSSSHQMQLVSSRRKEKNLCKIVIFLVGKRHTATERSSRADWLVGVRLPQTVCNVVVDRSKPRALGMKRKKNIYKNDSVVAMVLRVNLFESIDWKYLDHVAKKSIEYSTSVVVYSSCRIDETIPRDVAVSSSVQTKRPEQLPLSRRRNHPPTTYTDQHGLITRGRNIRSIVVVASSGRDLYEYWGTCEG